MPETKEKKTIRNSVRETVRDFICVAMTTRIEHDAGNHLKETNLTVDAYATIRCRDVNVCGTHLFVHVICEFTIGMYRVALVPFVWFALYEYKII